VVARVRGEGIPSEPESLGGDDEEEEEEKVTPPPLLSGPEDLTSLGDLFCQQAGISVGVRRSRQP
jgi:hypothetical protein